MGYLVSMDFSWAMVSFYLSTILGLLVGGFSLYLGGAHLCKYYCFKREHECTKYAYNHVFGTYVGLKTALKKKMLRYFVGLSHLITGLVVILMLLYSMIFQVRHSVKKMEGAGVEKHGIMMFLSALFLLVLRFHAEPPWTFSPQGLDWFIKTVIWCVAIFLILNVMHFCSGADKEQMRRAYQQYDAMRHGADEKFNDAKAFMAVEDEENNNKKEEGPG